MTDLSQEVEHFLANGGKIQQLPPSKKEASDINFCKFNRAEINQVLEFLRLNGPSNTKDISRYLKIKSIKLKSALSIAREHGHVVSQLINGKQIWELTQ